MIIQMIILPDHTTVFTKIVVLFVFRKYEKITTAWSHKNRQWHTLEPKNVAGMGGSFFIFKRLKVVIKS